MAVPRADSRVALWVKIPAPDCTGSINTRSLAFAAKLRLLVRAPDSAWSWLHSSDARMARRGLNRQNEFLINARHSFMRCSQPKTDIGHRVFLKGVDVDCLRSV